VSKKASPPAARPRTGRSSGLSGRWVWLPVLVLVVLGVAVALSLNGRSNGSPEGRLQAGGVLPEGATAPPVRLPATTGATVDMAGFRNKRNVLLYFYEHAG
jgi:hypothetical protein